MIHVNILYHKHKTSASSYCTINSETLFKMCYVIIDSLWAKGQLERKFPLLIHEGRADALGAGAAPSMLALSWVVEAVGRCKNWGRAGYRQETAIIWRAAAHSVDLTSVTNK